MPKIYFIGDTHFGHKNIITYENRPFGSVEEMDSSMIERWNSTVSKEDIIFHVGDFSFFNIALSKDILSRLNGDKRLIMGNHDTKSVASYYEMGFQRVYDYPILLEHFWLVSHEPLYINSNMPYANIFGHVHGNPQFKDYSSQSFCVSVERIDYRPISFDEIKKLMETANHNEIQDG